MSRLIDADAIKLEKGFFENIDNVPKFFEWLGKQPTVDPVKRGKWIIHHEVKNIYGGTCIECSECGEKYVVQYIEDEKFCRNCGAKMDEVTE